MIKFGYVFKQTDTKPKKLFATKLEAIQAAIKDSERELDVNDWFFILRGEFTKKKEFTVNRINAMIVTIEVLEKYLNER